MNRKIALGAVGVSVALLVLWFVFLWGPLGGKLDDAEVREQTAAGVNSELELQRDRLLALEADQPALEAKVDALRLAVPDDADLADFILEANGIATASGVEFPTIAVTPPSASTDPSLPAALNVTIAVDGGYFQVLDYLDRLDTLDRIVVIDTLGLTPAGAEDGGTSSLSVAVSARMFTTAVPPGVPGEELAPVTEVPAEVTETTISEEAAP